MASRVLLVEDSAPMRDAIVALLAPECGVVRCVADGLQVLHEAAEFLPQAIVLDISLPGVNGMQLLPHLRHDWPEATIVMLTNYSEELYRREALARGADAYVLKNFANSELLPAIRRGRSRCVEP